MKFAVLTENRQTKIDINRLQTLKGRINKKEDV